MSDFGNPHVGFAMQSKITRKLASQIMGIIKDLVGCNAQILGTSPVSLNVFRTMWEPLHLDGMLYRLSTGNTVASKTGLSEV
jgi:hypothetical protein